MKEENEYYEGDTKEPQLIPYEISLVFKDRNKWIGKDTKSSIYLERT